MDGILIDFITEHRKDGETGFLEINSSYWHCGWNGCVDYQSVWASQGRFNKFGRFNPGRKWFLDYYNFSKVWR